VEEMKDALAAGKKETTVNIKNYCVIILFMKLHAFWKCWRAYS
jgi:hypothetical protein